MKRKTRKELETELIALTRKYEKKAFDFEQLVQVSLSLNSGLELAQLIQSILFLCMGHFGVARAGMFIRKDLNQSDLVLHRSQFGFSLDFDGSKTIPQDHELLVFLDRHYQCFSYQEVNDQRPGIMEATPLQVMKPDLIIPLRGKGKINGLIVLAEYLVGNETDKEQRQFALTLAALSGGAVHTTWLNEITTTDIMTGLRIRNLLMATLSSTILSLQPGETSRVHLLMIDIDNFKALNDRLGHVAGDEVIVTVARIIRENIRTVDLAARYGGEEFSVLIQDADAPTARKVAERIRRKIQACHGSFQSQPWSVTVSIGLGTFDPDLDASVEAFIHRTDTYLYTSKRLGKNRVTSGSKSSKSDR